MTALTGLDPATYAAHDVHQPQAAYPETNCWTDVVLELLHARGHEPLAALGCTLTLDHEGDQLTFFKPRPSDLLLLYGLDIHELQSYRPLRRHVGTQLDRGHTVIVEVDAWWLPDTAGSSYRQTHVKTAIAIESIDDERLCYFHNAGLHELTGDDLRGILAPVELPGYLEVVRFDAGRPLTGDGLRVAAVKLLRTNLDRRPAIDPFTALGQQLDRERDDLLRLDEAGAHEFAFATTRMGGAAAALAAAHVRWALPEQGATAAACLDRVAATTRTLTFRLLRRKPFDPAPLIRSLAADWTEAGERLHDLVD